MKLLLDTHIWIWSVSDSKRLSSRVAKALTNPENELWLSPASIWEVLLLRQKRRVEIAEGFSTWIRRAMTLAPLREAPLTFEVAQALDSLDLPHGDPADRFLAATAKVFDLTLVTADAQLIHAPGIKTLANR
ncbi:MAG TPA: type II toxin-antitoxin system VapC family toxin [Candidatus Solibacter sp.]|nr:type II toxin-antitoxin system VapC family toxin [Candidatus Solibacter sp.]